MIGELTAAANAANAVGNWWTSMQWRPPADVNDEQLKADAQALLQQLAPPSPLPGNIAVGPAPAPGAGTGTPAPTGANPALIVGAVAGVALLGLIVWGVTRDG